ncbi:hypothetical protein BDF20DRAFT_274666 [Mycotypha africana]|uniref:uncharacterized protein n=1 Tax=Mycotypha africana TaxID=64632 RepID=UPI002301F956|nr:uncharacterized protein BDF20DRAFT_274666 [Mycotypha africana]KAI8987569.1 hypothetical protein BDF20DRAFT_274666 [Mycotypha africana]
MSYEENNINWQELFGSSDEEEEEEEEIKAEAAPLQRGFETFCSNQHPAQPIVTFDAIPGLRLVRHALCHEEQMTLVYALLDNHFFSNGSNQAMLFGDLPNYIHWLESWVLNKYPGLFDEPILNKKKPLFDQAILNLYQKGDGIASHVDLLR